MENLPIASLCLFPLLYLAAVGLAVTLAFSDMGAGWERDHPPAGRRITATVLPVVAAVALVVPLLMALRAHYGLRPPPWTLLSVAALLPFGVLTAIWAAAWRREWPAAVRRKWGSGVVQTGVVGAAGCSALMLLLCEEPLWRSGVVLALQAGTAGTLGGLLALAIAASPAAREAADVATAVPGHVLAGGELLLGLAFIDVTISWFAADRPVGSTALMLIWVVAGIAAPAAGAAYFLRVWPRRPWVWPALFTTAFIGLWSATHLLFKYGELVPPPWQ